MIAAVEHTLFVADKGGKGMSKLRVLDLFSGIGGFSLGLERTGGFETVAFCEIDPFCRRVLAKHWPTVPCFEDVTTLRGEDVGTVDVICGGFPCQDISVAGLGAGLDGARSGLWSEYARLIGELRPSFVIVENVSALLYRGVDVVLGDLAALWFDAEWHCIPASSVGAPHRRDRLWIVAHANGEGQPELQGRISDIGRRARDSDQAPHPANANEGERSLRAHAAGMGRLLESIPRDRDWPLTAEPLLDRGADGLPNRMDRCGALGNAVVPQIPELIGNAILDTIREAA